MPPTRSASVSVESVQVKEMDDEHAECAAALEALLKKRDEFSLRAVLNEFEEHFAHEEALLDRYLYKDIISMQKGMDNQLQAGGFSADASSRRSHHADHARMVQIIRQQLDRPKESPFWEENLVPQEFAQQIVADFETHALRYDGMYATRMAAAIEAEALANVAQTAM